MSRTLEITYEPAKKDKGWFYASFQVETGEAPGPKKMGYGQKGAWNALLGSIHICEPESVVPAKAEAPTAAVFSDSNVAKVLAIIPK